jgi:dipeptidyl aminopeptidase/acylaminoacyl peptidase
MSRIQARWILAAAGVLTAAAALWGWSRLPRYPGDPEPISFSNGDVRLSGILVKPRASDHGGVPAVVFVHGSGPSTVDDPIWTYHARAFAKRGFAVLVYDKRGSGRSTGSLAQADYRDLAGDVAAAVHYLRTRPDIDPAKIGLLGRSEGGWVTPIAAPAAAPLAFIVFSAGPTVPQLEETLYQARRRLERAGIDATRIDSIIAARRAEMKAAGAGLTGAAAIPFYDPLPALRALDVPLLALYAEKDEAIPTDTCIAVLRKLIAAGHTNIEIRTFQHVGHNFLLWRRPPIFANGYLEAMVDFAVKHTAPGATD